MRAETFCSKPGLNVVQVCSESSRRKQETSATQSHYDITLKNDASDARDQRGKNPAALEAGKRLSALGWKTSCL
jgi:hypothetical protein